MSHNLSDAKTVNLTSTVSHGPSALNHIAAFVYCQTNSITKMLSDERVPKIRYDSKYVFCMTSTFLKVHAFKRIQISASNSDPSKNLFLLKNLYCLSRLYSVLATPFTGNTKSVCTII